MPGGKPLRISVHALGGQGGGVLSDWIVDLAEHCEWRAQATSVPGVAQRTGATVYYIELAEARDGAEPVMALMPTPGDVDVVLAAELMEAGRAMARGLVTPDRTTLIASSHRVFAIGEKMALGNGIASPAGVLEAAGRSARRLVMADFGQMAEARGSVISASMFGALAGSGALPFGREAYEEAIRRSGKGVEASLRAFAAGYEMAGAPAGLDGAADPLVPAPPAPRARLAALAAPAQAYASLGVERLTDFQGPSYAALYAERLDAVAKADAALGGEAEGWALTAAAARHLALWMSFEDAIRVADFKTRGARLERVRSEAKVRADQVSHATEYMHPRYEELCDMLPAKLGRRMLASGRGRRLFASHLDRGRTVTTTRLSGFLLLWSLARLRRWRPRTLRYGTEQARIEAWLQSAINAARIDYALGVEVLRLQRLVKGYGETHARGWGNYSRIMGNLPALVGRPDAAAIVRELHEAALADDEGTKLGRAVRTAARKTGLALVA